MSVTASGSGAVTYQWSRKGKAIAGATSATFVIAGATRADSGWYLVEATDASGTKRSKPIFVAVTPMETEVVAWGRNLVNEVTVPSGLPRITAVSTDGYSHTLALTASGAVVGWGYYSSDYSPLPIAEDGFVAVAAGGSTNMALKSDSTVVCWRGSNNKVPAGLTDVVSIAATTYSDNSCYALKSDGTLVAWNSSTGDLIPLPSGLSGVVEISAGVTVVDALKNDGTVVALDGTTTGRTLSFTNVDGVSAYGTTTVLKTDGTVQISTDGFGPYYFPPTGLANVVSVATGSFHFLALKTDGTVVGWGENAYGQSTTTGLNHIWAITAAYYQSVGLRAVSSWNDLSYGVTTFPPALLGGTPANFTYTVKNTGVATWSTNHQMALIDSNGANVSTVSLNGVTAGQNATLNFSFTAPVTPGTYSYHLQASENGTAFGDAQELILVVFSATPSLPDDSASGMTNFPAVTNVDSVISFDAVVVNTGSQTWGANHSFVFTDSAGTGLGSAALNGTVAGGFRKGSFSFTAPTTPGNYTYHLKTLVNGASFGQDKTLTLTVKLPAPPVVTTSSATRNVLYAGQDLTLAFDASGEGALTCEWKHNGRVIAGATSNTYHITAAKYSDGGWYRATVTNRGGTVQSKIMFVAVTPATGTRLAFWGVGTAKVLLPANLTDIISIGIGLDQSLGVRRDGSVVRWGESNVQVPPSGLADVVMVAASSSHGLALKSDGTVVGWGPGVGSIPTGLKDVVSVACNFYYSLALLSDGTVVAWGTSNSYGQLSVPGGLSHVVAIAAGFSNAFAVKDDGTVIKWGSGSPYGGLSNVTAVSSESAHALFLKADGTVVALTENADTRPVNLPSGLANVVGVAAGNTHSLALRSDGSVVAWGTNETGQCTIPASLANVLSIGAGNGFSVALVGIDPSWISPGITTQSASRLATGGQSVTFTASASGSPAPTYQWQKNNVDIDGATGNSYTIPNVAIGDAATYTVIATNYVGSSTSHPMVLSVLSNENHTISTSLPVGLNPGPLVVNPTTNKIYVINQSAHFYDPSHTVTVIDGVTNEALTVDVGAAPSALALNSITDKIYVTHVAGSPNDSVTVIDGKTNGMISVPVGYSPKSIAINPVTNKIYVANETSANVTIIDGVTNATTTVAVGFSPEAIGVNPVTNKIYVANETSANVTIIDGATNATSTVVVGSQPVAIAVNSVTNKIYVANYSSNNVTVIDGVTNATSTVAVAGYSPRSVEVNSTTNEIYVIGGTTTVIDGVTNMPVAVAAPGSDGSPYGLALDRVLNRAYVAYGFGNSLTKIDGATKATTTAATGLWPYAVAVNPATGTVYATNVNDGTVTVLTWLATPTITMQPTSQTVNAGHAVTLTVTASGAPAPTFQWKKNGVNITGAVGSTYTIASTALSDTGNYTVVVTNSAGSVTSNVAMLTIQSAPVIVEQPLSQSIGVSFPVTLRVVVNAVPTPTYQWRKNGVNMNGATGSSYMIGNVTMSDAGTYSVVVSNTLGSVTSNGAVLSVVAFNPVTAKRSDFNGDGKVDILWEDAEGGSHGMWLMNGTGLVGWVDLGQVPPPWHMVAAADFNGDGKTDILWEDAVGGSHGIWLMNGTAVVGWVDLGQVPPPWHMVAAADFNGDGKTDILWEDAEGGSHGIWLMNGTAVVGWADLGQVPPPWHMVAAADFNGDGKTDILWEDTEGGSHGIWLMNGTAVVGWTDLGQVPPPWHMVTAGDFNGDGKTDILWEEPVSGSHGVWLMNGTAVVGWADLGQVPAPWHMVP